MIKLRKRIWVFDSSANFGSLQVLITSLYANFFCPRKRNSLTEIAKNTSPAGVIFNDLLSIKYRFFNCHFSQRVESRVKYPTGWVYWSIYRRGWCESRHYKSRRNGLPSRERTQRRPRVCYVSWNAKGESNSKLFVIIWPAPWACKIELSCPLGTTRRVPLEKFPRKPYNKSFIDQACSVKMAGYW